MRCDLTADGVAYDITVSIPAGFSNALRRGIGLPTAALLGQFQSLLGFLMRCDACVIVCCPVSAVFQSLLGFLMRCDTPSVRWVDDYGEVSIPAGFSNALRPLIADIRLLFWFMFQSLLGFLMRCDTNCR